MGVISKILEGFGNFGKGLQIIFGKPEPGEGDRKLAKASQITYGEIAVYGKDAVRRGVVKAIYKDLKRANKKGGKEEMQKLINNAISTPEYMHLINRLGLEKNHLYGAMQEVASGKA